MIINPKKAKTFVMHCNGRFVTHREQQILLIDFYNSTRISNQIYESGVRSTFLMAVIIHVSVRSGPKF